MTKEESYRFYLNLRASSTPIMYERISAAGFTEDQPNAGQDEHIQIYGQSSDPSSLPDRRFEILVFFVCKIERLLKSTAENTDGESNESPRAITEREPSGVRNYCRLLVMMT